MMRVIVTSILMHGLPYRPLPVCFEACIRHSVPAPRDNTRALVRANFHHLRPSSHFYWYVVLCWVVEAQGAGQRCRISTTGSIDCV